MIFIHLLIGILLGKLYGHSLFFILGSVFPDMDHIYIILKNKLWYPKKIIDSIKHEKKFNIKYKTPLLHSVLGLIIFSSIIYFFDSKETMYFAIAYFLHLLIDWIDIDEKYFLYPTRIKFRGFLPIWSKSEQMITILLILLTLILFLH